MKHILSIILIHFRLNTPWAFFTTSIRASSGREESRIALESFKNCSSSRWWLATNTSLSKVLSDLEGGLFGAIFLGHLRLKILEKNKLKNAYYWHWHVRKVLWLTSFGTPGWANLKWTKFNLVQFNNDAADTAVRNIKDFIWTKYCLDHSHSFHRSQRKAVCLRSKSSH